MSCGIYKYENPINHKVYIGQAIDLKERHAKHYKNVSDKYHQEDIYKAFREFGFNNFIYEILEEFEEFDQDKLNQLECYYIKKFNSLKPNGYNMVPGGNNGAGLAKGKPIEQYDLQGKFIATYPSAHQAAYATGIDFSSICSCARGEYKHTGQYQWKYVDSDKSVQDVTLDIPQTNVAIWQYDLNGKFIQEFQNFSQACKAISVTKSALCNCLKGKSNTCAGYKWSYANKEILRQKQQKKGKQVAQFDKNKKLIKIYNSATEAAKETGISNSQIGKACNGKASTAGGFIWQFVK